MSDQDTQPEGSYQAAAPNPLFDKMLAEAQEGLNPQDVINTVTAGYEQMMPQLQKQLMSRLDAGLANKSLPPEIATMMEGLITQTMGKAFSSAATIFTRDPVNVTPKKDDTPEKSAAPVEDDDGQSPSGFEQGT